MTNLAFSFTHPWLLLLLIPAIGVALIPYFLVKKKYRRNRNRITSLVLHCVAITLAVFLLSGVTYSYDIPNKENELILLVDCSDSNAGAYDQKYEFIEEIVRLCGDDYRLGIVKFGYDQVYAAELSNDSEEVYRKFLQSADPDTSATDVESALKYASKLFKNPSNGKIVLVGDGIETDGSATSVIKSIAAEGIKVDTAFYPNETQNEVQIVGIKMPDYKIIVGDTFKIEMSLKSNFGVTDIMDPEQVERGFVDIIIYDNEEESDPIPCMLREGDQTVEIPYKFMLPGMHKLRFEIKTKVNDIVQNNEYYAFVKLEDLNNILLIERRSGESQVLQDLLGDYGFNVTALGIDTDVDSIPKTVKDLCKYEQVILVNIANSDMPSGFDEILYKYVNQLGGGLFTVGGENEEVDGKLIPHAYDSEDLANTLLAEMLPVQAIDYTPPVAVMIVIDCSGSMSGGKLPQAQIGAKACLDSLSTRDFCGVMSFDTEAGEAISVIPVSEKDKIIKAINEVDKGEGSGSGGTVFSTAIANAGRALASVKAERRHIIIVTDGNPTDDIEKYGPYIDINVAGGITMSVVGISIDASNIPNMETTCERGGGVFYNVTDFTKLPSIMHEDMEMEAITGIKYGEEFVPTVGDHTAIFAGVDVTAIPPLTGYYGTKKKEGALVPLEGKYVPIYAQWKFGEGTVGSFMSDLNGIWSEKFMGDIVGQTLVRNIVKSIFPSEAPRTDEIEALIRQDNYTVQVSVSSILKEGESVGITVTPLTDDAKEFYKEPIPMTVADGFSRFTFDITCGGIYDIKIDKLDAEGGVVATMTLTYAFSYSAEYDYFPSKELIGQDYAEAIARDGKGVLLEVPADALDSFDKNIHKTVDPRLALLICVIILFLMDIAVRKFKFKLPHELIKDYKLKKAEKDKR